MIRTKLCARCDKDFEFKSNKAKYCSPLCCHEAYKTRNPDKVRARRRKWWSKNKDQQNEKRRTNENKGEYWRKRRSIDPMFRLKNSIRNRVNELITGKVKNGSVTKDLGCSWDQLRFHLENQFVDGMSWDNYGKWHVDHIKPLDMFDLANADQFKQACHYTNLQPLWAEDNIAKSNKV